MTKQGQSNSVQAWTSKQTCIMVLAPLLAIAPVGYAAYVVGCTIRGPVSTAALSSALAATVQQQSMPPASMNGDAGRQLSLEQRKAAADKQAGPMIEQLASSPNKAALAAQIGNIYYDAQVFASAARYYRRSLSTNSENLSVRIDLATALFNTGDIDSALAELNRVLHSDPDNNAALFNRGLVRWQGKKDVDGAVADWESILRHNPNYAQADKVRTIIALARGGRYKGRLGK